MKKNIIYYIVGFISGLLLCWIIFSQKSTKLEFDNEVLKSQILEQDSTIQAFEDEVDDLMDQLQLRDVEVVRFIEYCDSIAKKN